MAAEKNNTEEKNVIPETEAVSPKKKSSINSKIFTLWLPLYIVQLIAVYFITAHLLMNNAEKTVSDQNTKATVLNKKSEKNPNSTDLGKYIFSIDDVIINPAGTEGKRLLLASIGFDLKSEEDQQLLKGREILVKDAIISTLSSKSIDQLSNSTYRDTLKSEIGKNVKHLIPEINLNTVYLSKYIIQ